MSARRGETAAKHATAAEREAEPGRGPGAGHAGEGRVEALWLKRERRQPMVPVARVRLVAGRGLAGNWNQGGTRQVTIIEREKWDRVCEELDADVDPALRRANVMVRGVDLRRTEGRILTLGGSRIRIEGETLPCGLMDRQHEGLRRALGPEWRGGAYGVVLDDGEVEVGDPVAWRREGERQPRDSAATYQERS